MEKISLYCAHKTTKNGVICTLSTNQKIFKIHDNQLRIHHLIIPLKLWHHPCIKQHSKYKEKTHVPGISGL
jgi:hypothetical protein